jgi:Tol biopolymer transport system component
VVVYRTGGPFNETQLTWYDRSGKESGTLGTGMYINLRLSRDGKRLAIDRADLQSGLRDIWSMPLDRAVLSRLTFGPGNNQTPTWSPDASTLVYTISRPDGPTLALKAVNGSTTEEIAASNLRNAQDWSPDGQFLLTTVLNGEANSGYDVFIYSIKEKKASPYIVTRFNEGQPRFSPDGKWVVYCSDESGRQEIYIQPFPATGQKWQVSTAGGHWPRWPSKGKELFYINPEGAVVSVEIHTGAGVDAGFPKALFKHPVLLSNGSFGFVDPFDVAPDGNRFLLAVPKPENIREPLTVITNWRKAR